MKLGAVPDEVRRFILTSVPSVPYAEAVLLLRRHPGRGFGSSDLARALYITEKAAQDLLLLAEQTGVARAGADGHRYQPLDAALGEAWDRFAACYASDLIGVTQLIHGATQKSAQLFADAFKLRREP
jgi:hypothetical protein